jgi:pyruvate formate lyase activating enzyme
MQAKGRVFNLQRFSIHDGPGVRTTVFLKGCPLRCLWCHNPEGMSSLPEIVHREARCIGCGECARACSLDALSIRDGVVSLDHSKCSNCGSCGQVCPTAAMEMAGRERLASEVLADIERDRPFYDESGGGVTLSGGEPLLQPRFTSAILRGSRDLEIHTAVETCGCVPSEVLFELAPLVDLFLFDLKLIDDERHGLATGLGNKLILANLERLASEGRRIVVRTPIIPTINDDEANLLGIGRFVRSLDGSPPMEILPYHAIAREKYRRLGRDYSLADLELPSREKMLGIARLLEGLGLAVTVGG